MRTRHGNASKPAALKANVARSLTAASAAAALYHLDGQIETLEEAMEQTNASAESWGYQQTVAGLKAARNLLLDATASLPRWEGELAGDQS